MHQMTDEQTSILDKVKKLLDFANSAKETNEAMAENYAAKAMELLAAHNLDMAMIGKTAKGSQRKDNKLRGGLYGWQRDLWKAVSELNFCMYWSIKGLQRGSTYEHRILGREENVVGAQVMAEYLQQTVERMAREYAKAHFPGSSIFIKELIAYREGVSYRLVHKLAKLRSDRMAEDKRKQEEEAARQRHPSYSGSGTALVLADVLQSEDDLNNDYLCGYEPGTTSQRRRDEKARQAAANAAYELAIKTAKEKRDAEEAADPKLRDLRLAKEAAEKEASDKWWDEYERRNAAKERRRSSRPTVERTRAPTPAEQRMAMGTFHAGYNDGASVGLDKQIDEGDEVKKLEN